MANPKFIESLERDKLIKELTTFTPADIAVMEEQAEALYHAKRTRFKYRRSLQLALADQSKPRVPSAKQPRPVQPSELAVGLCGGVVFAGGSLGLFMLVLWSVSCAFK